MSDRPECERFKGRHRDLCEGEGRDGRPNPGLERANNFRRKHGLELLTWAPDVIAGWAGQRDSIPVSIPRTPSKPRGRPGSELKAIFDELGVAIPGCEGCTGTAARMDAAGVIGCREKRAVFLAEIKDRAKDVPRETWRAGVFMAIRTGWAFSVDLFDPISSLYDEAVNRAERKEQA